MPTFSTKSAKSGRSGNIERPGSRLKLPIFNWQPSLAVVTHAVLADPLMTEWFRGGPVDDRERRIAHHKQFRRLAHLPDPPELG
jgi:hypothetical protein